MSHYKVKLDNFEGPLDLLLFFIRKDELNIYEIPISYITRQYLDYIQLMKVLDLDIASEFILMAATLMRIKVKSMLPKTFDEEDGEDEITTAEELTRRLIEYRQYKDSAEELTDLSDHWSSIYRRSYYHFEMQAEDEDEQSKYDVSLFDLLAAFKQVLETADAAAVETIKRPNVTLEKQTKFLLTRLDEKKQISFFDLFEGGTDRSYIIVTFLAILELMKTQVIEASQSDVFGELWIHRRAAEYAGENAALN